MPNFLYPTVGIEWAEKQAKWVKSFCKRQKSQALELGALNLGVPSTKISTRMEQFIVKSFPLLEEGREVGAMSPIPQGVFTRDKGEALHGGL